MAGASTTTDFVDTHAISADESFLLDYYVGAYSYLKCVFAVTGGGATDTITVQASSEAGR